MLTRFYLPFRRPKDGAFILVHGVLGNNRSRKYFTNELVDGGPDQRVEVMVSSLSLAILQHLAADVLYFSPFPCSSSSICASFHELVPPT